MPDSTHDPYHDVMEDYAGGPVVGNDGNFLADVNDNDAQILDSLVDQHAEPPEPSDLPVVRIDMRPIPKAAIPALARLTTRSMTIGDAPLQLVPSNAYRSRVVLTATVDGDSPAILYVGDSRTAVQSPLTSARVQLGDADTFDMIYNGELWAASALPGTAVSIFEYINQEVGK